MQMHHIYSGLLKSLPEPQTEVVYCSLQPKWDYTITEDSKSPTSVFIAFNPFKPQGDLFPLQACKQ